MTTEVRRTLIAPKGICLMHEFSSAIHKAKTTRREERDEGRVEGAVKVDGGGAETVLGLRETK